MTSGVYERTEENKTNISKGRKKIFKRGYINPFKNKSHSAESKNRMSKSRKKLFECGYIHPMKGKHISESHKKSVSKKQKENPSRYWKNKKRKPFSDEWKKNISKIRKGKTYMEIYGEKRTKEIKELKRNIRLKQIKENNSSLQIGKHEQQILDELELSNNIKIIRQYTTCGYIVDGYIDELNLCIEVDENFHKYQQEKDKIRENNIKEELKCKFLRIKDTYDF